MRATTFTGYMTKKKLGMFVQGLAEKYIGWLWWNGRIWQKICYFSTFFGGVGGVSTAWIVVLSLARSGGPRKRSRQLARYVSKIANWFACDMTSLMCQTFDMPSSLSVQNVLYTRSRECVCVCVCVCVLNYLIQATCLLNCDWFLKLHWFIWCLLDSYGVFNCISFHIGHGCSIRFIGSVPRQFPLRTDMVSIFILL